MWNVFYLTKTGYNWISDDNILAFQTDTISTEQFPRGSSSALIG